MDLRRRLPALVLLALCPLSLSATRDDPKSPTTAAYDEITVTVEPLDYIPEEDPAYCFTVRNDGDGYVVPTLGLTCRYGESQELAIPGKAFLRGLNIPCLAEKGASFTLTWSGKEAIDFASATYVATAYVVPSESFSYVGSMRLKEINIPHHWIIDATLSYRTGDYRHICVIEMEYEGVVYFFSDAGGTSERQLLMRVEDDGFDPEKANIKRLICFDYEAEPQHGPDYAGFAMGAMLYALIIYGGVIVFIVAPAIVIPIVIVRARRKRGPKQ